MVILHPRTGSQHRDQFDETQPSTVLCEGANPH